MPLKILTLLGMMGVGAAVDKMGNGCDAHCDSYLSKYWKRDCELREAVDGYVGTATEKSAVVTKYGEMKDWDMSEVTCLDHAFDGNENSPALRNIDVDISKWDVSAATSMRSTFVSANTINTDLSEWDVSKVTEMHDAFHGAVKFNSDLSKWDTGKVTDMSEMFYGCKKFNGAVNTWDTSKVTDMEMMFRTAWDFDQDISYWDTSKVTSIKWMLENALAFNQPLDNFGPFQITDALKLSLFNKEGAYWDEDNYAYLTGTDSCKSEPSLVNNVVTWSTKGANCPDRAAAPAPAGNLKYLQCDDLEEAYAAHCDCNIHGQDISTTSDLLTKIKSGLDFSCPY